MDSFAILGHGYQGPKRLFKSLKLFGCLMILCYHICNLLVKCLLKLSRIIQEFLVHFLFQLRKLLPHQALDRKKQLLCRFVKFFLVWQVECSEV